MNQTVRRALAASIPVAMLAGATLSASAAPIVVRGANRPAVTVGPNVKPAAAAVTAYGGGATFPIPAYVGVDLSSGSTTQGAAGSVFGYLFPGLTYCATGSGKGKGVFTGPLGTVQNPCANAGTGTPPYGFSAPAGTLIPALTGTDSPLGSSDYGTYVGANGPSSKTLEPTELPSIVGSVAMFYNEPTCRLALTEATIANIFNGTTTVWGKVPGCASTNKDPITVVYRSDGSGTSFVFSNNLATTAPTAGFSANQQFYTYVDASGVTHTGAYPTAPTNSVGAKGNGGVYNAVQATAHAIGYVEEGFVATHAPTAGRSALVVNPTSRQAQDPLKNVPEAAASITNTSIAYDSVVVTGSGPATTETLATAGFTPAVADCVVLVKPSAYANPTKGYPIVGVTYLLAAYKGNTTLTTPERNTLIGLNTPTNFAAGKITTVDPATTSAGLGKTGYSALSTSLNAIVKYRAVKCINT